MIGRAILEDWPFSLSGEYECLEAPQSMRTDGENGQPDCGAGHGPVWTVILESRGRP
jgi:hypothetical protein